MTDAPAVIDNQAASRFEHTENGRLALLTYRVRPGRLVLLHTETPPQFQGRGIGSALVRAAIERAEREHLTVVVYCPFARSWLEQHPAEASRVTVELPAAS
jgi:predicted GNAT family acetyltransferase